MSRQVYKQNPVASGNISGYFQNNSTVCDLFPEISNRLQKTYKNLSSTYLELNLNLR